MDLEGLAGLWACVGRRSDYAIQQRDGRYFRVKKPVTEAVLTRHLAGWMNIGTYVLDEEKRCSFAVFDADQKDGLAVLSRLQADLAAQGYPAYLERSRRGGHLWLFLREACPASLVRAWLLPLANEHRLELFPKQSAGRGVGSLIRLPLGIHQRSGKRYPFLNEDLQAVAPTLQEQLRWLARVQRVMPPPDTQVPPPRTPPSPALPRNIDISQSMRSIRDWNAAQDPFALIGRYVRLNHNGCGHCPFSEHHSGGRDEHVSFQVFYPQQPGGMCWYCYAWGKGGTAFDFLLHYHHLDVKTLWHQLRHGEIVP